MAASIDPISNLQTHESYFKPSSRSVFQVSQSTETPPKRSSSDNYYLPSPQYDQADYGVNQKPHAVVDLYNASLANGPLVGHVAGAIAIIWFNSWRRVIASVRGESPINLLNMGSNFYGFMRYLQYVIVTGKIKQHTLMVSLLYLCRFSQKSKRSMMRFPTSEARILITSLMVADKHEDDINYSSSIWARLGNIKLEDVTKMEIEFLSGIDFDLHISSSSWAEFNQFTHGYLFPLVDRLTLRLR